MIRAALVAVALTACTPAHLDVKGEPGDALKSVEGRLKERGIALDPSGRRVDRLRTAHFCYVPLRQDGGGWDATFASPSPGGPVGFAFEGALDEQKRAEDKCPHLVRVGVTTAPGPEGARVVVEPEWYRLRSAGCSPKGDLLLGIYECRYKYVAEAEPPGDVAGWIYRLLAGI